MGDHRGSGHYMRATPATRRPSRRTASRPETRHLPNTTRTNAPKRKKPDIAKCQGVANDLIIVTSTQSDGAAGSPQRAPAHNADSALAGDGESGMAGRHRMASYGPRGRLPSAGIWW